jgi:uncharacterized protein (DUF488 family)
MLAHKAQLVRKVLKVLLV